MSAARLSLAGYDAVSLMGTNLNMEKLLDVARSYPQRTCKLCLDRDATTKALLYADRFGLLVDMEVRTLLRDLKYLTDTELGEVLS